MKKRVFIFISGGGSNMASLIASMKFPHPGYPHLVVSNKENALGLLLAKDLKVPAEYIPINKFEQSFFKIAGKAEPDVICLAGFMQILTPTFIKRFKGKILNIHPSLLPKYKGLKTHERAILAKEKTSGCTVHIVNEKIDAGRILGQAIVPIQRCDTATTLKNKVLEKEHVLYPQVLKKFLEKTIS